MPTVQATPKVPVTRLVNCRKGSAEGRNTDQRRAWIWVDGTQYDYGCSRKSGGLMIRGSNTGWISPGRPFASLGWYLALENCKEESYSSSTKYEYTVVQRRKKAHGGELDSQMSETEVSGSLVVRGHETFPHFGVIIIMASGDRVRVRVSASSPNLVFKEVALTHAPRRASASFGQ